MQDEKRKKLYGILGNLPPKDRKPVLLSRKIIQREPYIVEKLLLDLNGIEDVPAYLLKPAKTKGKDARLPLILYNHAHGSWRFNPGKEELLSGRKSMQKPAYGEVLTEMGYAVLCIDHWAFGKRNQPTELTPIQKIISLLGLSNQPTESKIFKKMLWEGRSMWGMMLYDNIKALDYTLSRKEIDRTRVGTLGFSMGSTMAWWHAALDERIKVCVDICCLTDFYEFARLGRQDLHSVYYYVHGLLNEFSTSDINSLIAPRAHLSLAGGLDPLTPMAGLRKIDAKLRRVYKEADRADSWKIKVYRTGHKETAEMREEVLEFLRKHL